MSVYSNFLTDLKKGEGSQFDIIFLYLLSKNFRLGEPILVILFHLKAGCFPGGHISIQSIGIVQEVVFWKKIMM